MTDSRLTVRAAQAAILARVRRGHPTTWPLLQAAGLVLAEGAVAPVDVPPHLNAAMDGYAVRAADVAGATAEEPVDLPVAGIAPAGGGIPPALAPGTAMRIFTGGIIPRGADTVIRQEDTDRGAATVRIHSVRDLHRHLRPAGGDVAAGSVPVPAGSRLTPARLGLLASIGRSTVEVIPPPRVGILVTGDELAAPGEEALVRHGERLGNSNATTLHAAVEAAGGRPVLLGVARDEASAIETLLRPALAEVDLLITTGGVSVGDRDLVRATLATLGAEECFHRLRLRPGGPVVFGLLPGGQPWFGLPGNPVSALVTFLLLVRPAIRQLLGRTPAVAELLAVAAAEEIAPDPVLELYLRCRLTERPGQPPLAHLTGAQGSQILTSMADADALIVVPPGTVRLDVGTELRAVDLRE